MARKPKPTPPIEALLEPPALDETPAPARRGRPPKSARTPSPSPSPSPSPAAEHYSVADANADDAGAGAPDTISKRLQGRKPKPRADAAAAPLSREGPRRAVGRQNRKPDGVELAAELKDASRSAGAADGKPVDEATVSPAVSKPLSSTPAARWDRATDAVRFDWPEIERTASQDGPNQVMAKLLVAARAEGAHSRWPF